MNSTHHERTPMVVVGAYVPRSGFTRVLLNILEPLVDEYEVHFVGMSYKGAVIRKPGLTIYPCNLNGGDVFGAYQARELIRTRSAKLVFLLNDLWMLKNYMPVFDGQLNDCKVITYVPLDGKLVDDSLMAPFGMVDRFVAYTKFGRDEMKSALDRLRVSGAKFKVAEIDVIPHGTDVRHFFPLCGPLQSQLSQDGRRQAKEKLFPEAPELHDGWMVLNANRPMPRKRIDLTLRGFAKFAQAKPKNVCLVLHHAIMNDEERQGIWRLADELGVVSRLRMPEPIDQMEYGSDEYLNLVYNACEIGINTAMGEGWGLVSFEHAATGAAQIVPDNSACAELWATSARIVPTGEPEVPGFSLLKMSAVTVDGVADALASLYDDVEHCHQLSIAAYHDAHRGEYFWGAVVQQWKELFVNTVFGDSSST